MFKLGSRSLRGALNAAQVHGAAGGVRQLSDCFVTVFIIRGSETFQYCSRFLSCSYLFSGLCLNKTGPTWKTVLWDKTGTEPAMTLSDRSYLPDKCLVYKIY